MKNLSVRISRTGVLALVCATLIGPSTGHAAKSKGTIKVLGVRVVFKDAGGPAEKTIEQRLNSARLNFGKFSYGKLDIIVRTETVILPNNRTSYSGTEMKAAARAKLKAKGILIAGIEIFGFYPGGTHFGSHATVGGNEFISSSTGGSTMHEMGHNFGWGHQSRWASNNSDPIGAGKLITPDAFHFMKSAGIDPEPSEKWGHGWLTDRYSVSSNGSYTYRLYTFDQKNIDWRNSKRAIRVGRTTSTKNHFWLAYRSQLLGNVSGGGKNYELRQGLCFWWERTTAASTSWLDMHPNTGGLDDHALQPGETYADTAGDVYITNLGRGGSEPNEYLDVRINRGTFAGNGAPVPTWDAPAIWKKGAKLTITIEGNDPDGDEVACMWTTPEQSIVHNTSAPTLTVTPSKLGNWQVKAVVSDMKGETKTISKTISIVSDWPISDWNGSDSTAWNTATNWTPEEVPNDRSATARWNSTFTGAFQLATTSAKTLRGLQLAQSLTQDVSISMVGPGSTLSLWGSGIEMIASDHAMTIDGDGGIALADHQTWLVGTGGGTGELNVLTDIEVGNKNLTINTVNAAEISVVNGAGNFTKKGVGALTLSGSSSHAGTTQISGSGSLLVDGVLSGGGSIIAISPSTLGGTGTVANDVFIDSNASLSPGGTNYGTLAVSGNLTLEGDLLMDVDRSGPTSDELNLTGSLTLAGSARLQVNNKGAILQDGDSFTLFSQATAGGNLLDITPAPGYPLAWNNLIASNGTIAVYQPGTLLSNSNGVSSVAYDSATLTGELITNDAPTEVRVYWGTSDGGINTNAWDHMASFGSVSSAQAFSTNVTGLSELTTYYYRYYGSNSNGNYWAETMASFKTPAAPLVPANFQYSMEISFSPSPGAELTNFPALVILDEAKSLFRYAQMSSSAGDDLRFTAIDGTTILNYEIENWNTESNSQVWVQVPLLTNNTTIIAHWGNTNGVASPAYTTDGSTWSEGYEGVWHMTGAEVLDSSPNARETVAINDVDSAAGKIAEARTFDGMDDSLIVAQYPGVLDAGRTVTAWIRTTAASAAITGWGNDAAGEHFVVGIQNTNGTSGAIYADVNDGYVVHDVSANDGAWHHAAVVLPDDGSADISEGLLYLDGVAGQSAVLAKSIGTTPGPSVRIGETGKGNLDWNGELDEVRISSVARSADWVGAAYLNMASNDTFNSLYDVAGIEVPMISVAGSVSAMMPYTVTLNAELLTTGAASTTVFVCYGQEDGGPVASTSAWEVVENRGISVAGALSFDVTNLYANTEYFFRIAATNSFGEAWTKMGAFQTPEDVPVIENNGISGIQETSVSLGGNLTSTGFAATTVHVYWGDQDAEEEPGDWDSSADLGLQDIGTFSTNVTGLVADTTYYFRYYASNSYGTAWASEATAITTPSSTLDTNRYGFKMKIEFPGYDGTETLTNFPALVVFNEALSNFHYGAFASLEGGDLRFTSSDGTNVLNYEVETWTTNGDSVVWVQVPELNTNTYIWAYGGNEKAVLAPPNTSDGSVWSEGYVGVWHMQDTSGLDSTAYGHHLTAVGGITTNATGRIAGALELDGANDCMQIAYDADLNPSNMTVSVWSRVTGLNYTPRSLVSSRNWVPAKGYTLYASSDRKFEFHIGDGTVWTENADGPTVGWMTWENVVGRFDQTTRMMALFVDGVKDQEDLVAAGLYPNTENVLSIGSGNDSGDAKFFKGQMDEVRISNVARSDDWLNAEYLSVASNGVFNSYGVAEHDVPVVSNDGGPTNLTPTSATLQGALLASGSDPAEVIVFHGEFDGGKNTNAWDAAVPLGVVSEGPLSINVTNLSPETEHYYRFYASNASGANWAIATTEVVPPSGRPELDELPESTDVTGVSATIISDLVSTGNAPTTVWAYWDSADAGTTNTAWANSINLGVHAVSVVSNTVAGLIPGQTYYYRFQATNHWGESWTEASTFTTEEMTPNLVATHAGSTLDINTDAKTLTYDADGAGPIAAVVHTASTDASTATWTFGDIHIGADTTLTFDGNDSRAIRLIADGTGYLSEGNIIIEKNFNLNGENGGGNDANGGNRTFGSGAGGDDKSNSRRSGETASSEAYARGVKGGGRDTNSSSQNKGGGGGAFGGSGGASNLGSPVGGTWYGRLDLAELGTADGPRAGSGGGAGNRGAGGSGGGAIQLLAINDVTIASGVSITADGGNGNGGGSTTQEKRRTGGGGSGGGIRIVADSNGDGYGTLTCDGATLSAEGGIANSSETIEYGGDGGGGRIVLKGASVIHGTINTAGGSHGGSNGEPGEDGSIFRDGKNGALLLSGNGIAANSYTLYSNLTVSAKSTLELGGDTNIMSVVVSNTSPAVIDGELKLEIDGTNAANDQLIVSSELDITDATLTLSTLSFPTNEAYVLAEYGAITGTFASVTGLPTDYALQYNYGTGSNQIALVNTRFDGDGDGIVDAWEIDKFGNTATANDSSNQDGDLFTDLQEYIADTNPTDTNSYLWIAIAQSTNTGIHELSFPSSLAREYWIESTTNLVVPFAPTSPAFPGDGGVMLRNMTNSVLLNQYYRVRVDLP
jgi:autotransporter-associated beta strand protein